MNISAETLSMMPISRVLTLMFSHKIHPLKTDKDNIYYITYFITLDPYIFRTFIDYIIQNPIEHPVFIEMPKVEIYDYFKAYNFIMNRAYIFNNKHIPTRTKAALLNSFRLYVKVRVNVNIR